MACSTRRSEVFVVAEAMTGESDWSRTSRRDRILGQPVEQESRISVLALSPDGRMILTVGPAEAGAALGRCHGLGRSALPVASGLGGGGASVRMKSEPSLPGAEDKIKAGCGMRRRAGLAGIGAPIDASGPIVRRGSSARDGHVIVTVSQDRTGGGCGMRASGQSIGSPRCRTLDWVWAVAFSRDGRAIVTGSQDKTAALWDAASGSTLGPPLVHPSGVLAVAFSPDGRTILTRSWTTRRRGFGTPCHRPALGPPMLPHFGGLPGRRSARQAGNLSHSTSDLL